MDRSKNQNSMSISEVAQELNISIDTLRYYEKEGIIPEVKRGENGYREFHKGDMKWLGFVNCLKSTGMPLNKIKQYQELLDLGNNTALQRRNIVLEHQRRLKDKIFELNTALERINHKVEFYDELIEEHGIEQK